MEDDDILAQKYHSWLCDGGEPTYNSYEALSFDDKKKVLAIGNPFGFNGTLTQGIISRIDYEKNRIQTDAAINPGSSGGPLLNKNGEIIGINQAIYNPDNNISNIGIGFAIPINLVKEYLKELDSI